MKVVLDGVMDGIWTRYSKSAEEEADYQKCLWCAKFEKHMYDFKYGVIVSREQYEDWTIDSWFNPIEVDYAFVPIHPLGRDGETMTGRNTSHVLFLFNDDDYATVFKLQWQ
jgi:hypothetical protein